MNSADYWEQLANCGFPTWGLSRLLGQDSWEKPAKTHTEELEKWMDWFPGHVLRCFPEINAIYSYSFIVVDLKTLV